MSNVTTRALAATLFLISCSSPKPPTPIVVPPSEEAMMGSVYVTASVLNVREDSTATSTIVTTVKRGDQLTLLGEQRGWSKVKVASGEVGWVSSQHISAGK